MSISANWSTGLTSTMSHLRNFGLATLIVVLLVATPLDAAAEQTDEQQVQALVEYFLITVGNGELEKLPALFAPFANIGAASLQGGEWVTSTMSFDAWLSELLSAETWTQFREPVDEFTVHIESSQLAFVRADARYIVGDETLSHNIDYFTLVRIDESWKILNASYTAEPAGSD